MKIISKMTLKNLIKNTEDYLKNNNTSSVEFEALTKKINIWKELKNA